jgi:hypothetical protein
MCIILQYALLMLNPRLIIHRSLFSCRPFCCCPNALENTSLFGLEISIWRAFFSELFSRVPFVGLILGYVCGIIMEAFTEIKYIIIDCDSPDKQLFKRFLSVSAEIKIVLKHSSLLNAALREAYEPLHDAERRKRQATKSDGRMISSCPQKVT